MAIIRLPSPVVGEMARIAEAYPTANIAVDVSSVGAETVYVVTRELMDGTEEKFILTVVWSSQGEYIHSETAKFGVAALT